MSLLMSLVVLAAVVLIIVMCIFFSGRASARRALAAERIDKEIATIQKQSLEADQRLVKSMLTGTLVDSAIDTFQRERSSLFSTGTKDEPWKWSADELEAYRHERLRRESETIGRQTLLPAIASILLVILVTAGLLVVLYPAPMEAREEPARIAPVPLAPVTQP